MPSRFDGAHECDYRLTYLLTYLLTYEKCKGKGFTYIIVTERWARS